MTKTAQSSIPPASFTASGLQTLASLPEVRGIILPANRQPGAQAPGNTKSAYGWAKSPVCPALPSSTSTPTRAKKAARCCQRSLRRECSMSGRFADAVRRRQIAGRRQGEQLAAREWPVLALHSRLLGGEPHPRWSVETAACQASTIGQLTTACATWFRDANEDDISNVGCWPLLRSGGRHRRRPFIREDRKRPADCQNGAFDPGCVKMQKIETRRE